VGDEYEEALRAVAVVAAGASAEDEGFEAVVIDSVLDSGLYALRSRLSIPVVGPGLAAFTAALTLGSCFSILAVDPKARQSLAGTLQLYGLGDKCMSVRTPPVGVAEELAEDEADGLGEALLTEARAAIAEDGAEVVVLGTTRLPLIGRELADQLERPVIDPGLLAFQMARRLRLLGLSHSKAAFPAPKRLQDGKFVPLLAFGSPGEPLA
jgi:allantoin racemase